MLIVQVNIHIKPDQVNAFIAATVENAKNSIQEPGIVRFDFYQQADDPHRFTLVEIYRTADDPPKHRETAHYQRWRDTAESMMVEPRTKIEYRNVFPLDDQLGK